MIKISYTNSNQLVTIEKCLEEYNKYLGNLIDNVRKNPAETIERSIIKDVLHRVKKNILVIDFNGVKRPKALKLQLHEAIVLNSSFLYYQSAVISPTDPHHHEVEALKLLLDPQTV